MSDLMPEIICTEGGLSISGTRITLYDIMGYLNAGWTEERTRDILRLSDTEMRIALDYIAAHHDAVEAEYQQVLRDAEEARRYWEERNRERLAQIAAMPPTPGTEAMRAKLAEYRARRAQEQADPARS
jgi:uncharacterized protein (DUF433 family)